MKKNKKKKEDIIKQKHKKWFTIIGYFETLSKPEYFYIKGLLDKKENIILMIRRKEGTNRKDQQNIFNGICKAFPNETKMGQMIISAVPDIEQVVFLQ